MTDDLHDQLDRLLDGLPALGPFPDAVVTRGARRRRTKLVGAGLGGGLAVAAAVAVLLPGDSAQDRLVPLTSPPASPSAEATSAPVVILERGGLGYLAGPSSIRHLEFEQADPAAVQDLLDRALGSSTSAPLPDCGANVVQVQYPGFTLVLDGGRFVGWSDRGAQGRSLTTADGLGVGSTLAQVREAVPDANVVDGSLGPEWSGGGIGGFLDGTVPTSKVTTISSGQNCLFR